MKEEHKKIQVDTLPWNDILEMEVEDEDVRTAPQQFASVVDQERRQGPPSSLPLPPLSPPSLKTTHAFSTDAATSRRRPRISFGHVHIVRFWPQLGDHPAVSSGCPIALGDPISPDDIHNENDVLDMDLYEETRPKRRTFQQLRIPAEERMRILLTMGHTPREIVGQARDIHLLRASKRRTSRQKQLDAYYGALVRRMGGAHSHQVQAKVV